MQAGLRLAEMFVLTRVHAYLSDIFAAPAGVYAHNLEHAPSA